MVGKGNTDDDFLRDPENWRFGPDLELRCWPMNLAHLSKVAGAIIEDERVSVIDVEHDLGALDETPHLAFRLERMPIVGLRVLTRESLGGHVSASIPPLMCRRACGFDDVNLNNMQDSRVHDLVHEMWQLAERVHVRVPLRFAAVFDETWGPEAWPARGGIATHLNLALAAGWPVVWRGEWTAILPSPIGQKAI